jgi:RNA polymerase sigma factor (sigma-70 family)
MAMAEPTAATAPLGRPMRLLTRNEAKLARLAAAGDERAFAAIYERYHQELYRYCRALLGDGHEAEDALQNTMASALRALPGESRRIELRPWLYRVARNESISLLRRRRAVAEAEESNLPAQPAADASFETRERLRSLVADLGALPERQRSALVMRELSGLSNEEIATALAISPAAARQVVYEARLALLEIEEGRSMECERVRLAISDRDGRVLRARKLRAHLRSCERCSDFRAAIETRRSDLELLAPPLSAVAASGLLAGLLGGGGSAVGGALGGGLVAGGASGSLATAKVLGAVAASAAIGIGAGNVSGVELPGLSGGKEPQATHAAPESPAPATGNSGAESNAGSGDPPSRADDATGNAGGVGSAPGNGKENGEEHGAKHEAPGQVDSGAAAGSAAGGASASAPAGSGQPETPPGSEVATDRSGGHSTTPTTGPAEKATAGPPDHANVGGRSAEHASNAEK